MSQSSNKPDLKVIEGGPDHSGETIEISSPAFVEKNRKWALSQIKRDLDALSGADKNEVLAIYNRLRETSDRARRLLSDRPFFTGEYYLETLDGLIPMRDAIRKLLELEIKSVENGIEKK